MPFPGTQPSSQMSKCFASSLQLSWVLRGPRGVIPHKVEQLGPRSPHAPSLREESSERRGQLWGLQLRPPAPSRVKRPLRPRVGLTLSTDPSLGKRPQLFIPIAFWLQGWQARLPATLRRPRHTPSLFILELCLPECVCLECACVMWVT